MDKLEYDKDFTERLESKKKENEVVHKGILEYKSDMHGDQRDFASQLKVNNHKRNPFNAKINE